METRVLRSRTCRVTGRAPPCVKYQVSVSYSCTNFTGITFNISNKQAPLDALLQKRKLKVRDWGPRSRQSQGRTRARPAADRLLPPGAASLRCWLHSPHFTQEKGCDIKKMLSNIQLSQTATSIHSPKDRTQWVALKSFTNKMIRLLARLHLCKQRRWKTSEETVG